MNEVPDDQEVAFVAHLLDHLDFEGEPPLVFRERISQNALLPQTLEVRRARGKPFADHFFEKASGGMAFGNLELREWIGDALNFDIAARSNVHGPAQRLGKFAENLRHFHGALEVKLVGRKLHAMRVAHGLAGLNAEQNFLSVGVFVMQIVAIVGGNQRNARSFESRTRSRLTLFSISRPWS